MTTTALDLGAVNVRALAAIQRSDHLDRNPPFRSRRTRLRWSAETSDGEQEIVFTLGADGLRTVRLRAAEPNPRALADFCADLALHDWLLSTLLDIVDRAVARSRPAAELIRLLRPGIDHLVHAWMPAAHVSRTLDRIWQELDLTVGILAAMAENRRANTRPVVRRPHRGTAAVHRTTEIGVRMTNGGMRRSLVPGNHLEGRVSPAPRADYARFRTRSAECPAQDSLVLTAVVAFAFALILFVVDTEIRISAVDERMAEGFAKIGRSAELSAMMERSALDTALLTDFLETASRADGRVNPLLQRLARREIERVTSFVRQLPVGSEIAYDGEDRDWLLGLTREAEHSDRRDLAVHGGRRDARLRRRALDQRPGYSLPRAPA